MSRSGGSQSGLRAANRARVLHALHGGELVQAELARRTGLSPATISTLVRDLVDEGRVDVSRTISRGRRARSVRLSRRAGVAVGIDFGRTHIRVAAADLAHRVIAEREVAIRRGADAQTSVDIGAKLYREMLADVGVPDDIVVSVGIGIPGPIDHRSGEVGSTTILPEWVGVRPGDLVASRLERPVLIENDANLGALAEVTWGAAREAENIIYVKMATGIGAGLVLGSRPYHGHVGMAGELGHITVREDGLVCRCGNRGCLETVASGEAILALLRPGRGPELTLGGVVELVTAGDVAAVRVVGDAGRHVGRMLAMVCNVLDPAVIVVGGTLAEAGPALVGPLHDAVRRHTIPLVAEQTQVRQTTLGRRSEVLGAVALALLESPTAVPPS